MGAAQQEQAIVDAQVRGRDERRVRLCLQVFVQQLGGSPVRQALQRRGSARVPRLVVRPSSCSFRPFPAEQDSPLLRYQTSKSGDESISFKDRSKEGQNDIYYITGESVAAVSSSPFLESLRKTGLDVTVLELACKYILMIRLPEVFVWT